jgi:hypothetical protein
VNAVLREDRVRKASPVPREDRVPKENRVLKVVRVLVGREVPKGFKDLPDHAVP